MSQVGNGRNWSLPLEFTTLQAVAPSFAPYRIGVVADIGVTDNSTTTFDHLTESLPDLARSQPSDSVSHNAIGLLPAAMQSRGGSRRFRSEGLHS